MRVPARYIAAVFLFALLPGAAFAECNTCRRDPSPPPPPPSHGCQYRCGPPQIVVPPPVVPAPNIVVVNAGARANASAMSIAIASVEQGDTIIRVGGGAQAGATAYAGAATTASLTVHDRISTRTFDRDVRISAICVDARNIPHPASQVFGEAQVPDAYAGEIYRCIAGTHMRVTRDGETFDCAQGEALWYENGQIVCRMQIARRPCNERSLLRRYGPGEKIVRIRGTETVRDASTEAAGALSMDGGVGQGVW